MPSHKREGRALRGVLVSLAVLAAGSPAAAQQLTWQGSIRPRAEAWDEDAETSRMFTGMRTRLSVARALSADGRLFIQVQDARLWGGDRGTTDGSADAFDLHQGYAELGHRGASPLWLRVNGCSFSWGCSSRRVKGSESLFFSTLPSGSSTSHPSA